MHRLIHFTATALTILSFHVYDQRSFGENIDWPGWLGPDRNGWVNGFQPPTPWPEQLQQRWQVEVGAGYGSPLVAGGYVYQHARQEDDEVVWCLNVETGAVEWRENYPAPFKMGGGGERHGKGPKSSPTLSDGRLFTFSITGVLTAWDATTGALLWQRDYRPRFEKNHPYWGAAASPLVVGSRVVVHFGTDGQGALIALKAATGEEVWSSGSDGPSYSSPIPLDVQETSQIVDWNERAVVGVDSESGQQLWEFPLPQAEFDQNMPTPTGYDQLVLLGAENRGVRSLKPHRENGIWTVQQRWHQKEVALDMSSAVMNDGLLYGFSHYGRGRLFCLNVKTGDVLWQGPGRTGDNVTFLAIPGYVLALTDQGELQVIAARSDQFQKVASYRVSESPTWSPPALLKDGVLVKDDQTLTRWSFTGK